MSKIVLVFLAFLLLSLTAGTQLIPLASAHYDKIRIEVEDGEFEIRGMVTDIFENSFIVSGILINIDPFMVEEFEQKEDLMIGENVKVEGIMIDDMLFAEEID